MLRLMAGLLSLVLWCAQAQAEQRVDYGDYQAHYSAFSSTFITPSVAKVYGIDRSRFKSLVNLVIQDPAGKAIHAQVSGVTRNLLGQEQALQFKEIEEGDSVYYLAEVEHINEERLNFVIQLAPEGLPQRQLQFSQTFYAGP